MLPMELFGNPRFSVASGAIVMAFFVLFGSVFLLTQHLQFVLGYTPLQTGVRVLPVAVVIVAAPAAARLTERVGSKLVVSAGLLIVAASLWLLSTVQLGDGYGRVAAALALLGAGMGFTVAPATESIMGSVPLAKAGVGSAMNDTTRQVGGGAGGGRAGQHPGRRLRRRHRARAWGRTAAGRPGRRGLDRRRRRHRRPAGAAGSGPAGGRPVGLRPRHGQRRPGRHRGRRAGGPAGGGVPPGPSTSSQGGLRRAGGRDRDRGTRTASPMTTSDHPGERRIPG
jgi:hypothetical protein